MAVAAPSSTGEDDLLRQILSVMSDDEVIGTTADLVRIELHRGAPGHETGVATHLLDRLVSEGIEAELREVRPGRPNVIGILPGHGGGPRLMFNGHTDTVPPGMMPKPFEPRIEGGMLFGRGACDMKGGLAAQLCAVIGLKRAGVRLGGDLIFAGVIAEEDGSNLGSLDVVEHGPRADMVVVAEPTNLQVAVAHKGFDYYRIEVEGIASDSSRPDKGINAIYRASAIVSAIEQRLAPRLGLVDHPLVGRASINVASIIGHARSEAATVFGGGPIEKPAGGTVPDTCTICLDHRRLPGSSTATLLAMLEQLVAEVGGDGPPIRVSFTPACPELELASTPGHPNRSGPGARMPAGRGCPGGRRAGADRSSLLVRRRPV